MYAEVVAWSDNEDYRDSRPRKLMRDNLWWICCYYVKISNIYYADILWFYYMDVGGLAIKHLYRLRALIYFGTRWESVETNNPNG